MNNRSMWFISPSTIGHSRMLDRTASLSVALLLLLCSTSSVIAQANSGTLLERYQAVGNGELTWWGMTIYYATLYSADGRYHPQRDHALQIHYRISVTAQRLAEVSLDQIEEIYGPQPQRETMIKSLASLFCDVKKGDAIIGYNHPGQGAQFYCNGKLTGKLDDPKLADAFFAIWLHPQTSEPELRAQLIGKASQ